MAHHRRDVVRGTSASHSHTRPIIAGGSRGADAGVSKRSQADDIAAVREQEEAFRKSGVGLTTGRLQRNFSMTSLWGLATMAKYSTKISS